MGMLFRMKTASRALQRLPTSALVGALIGGACLRNTPPDPARPELTKEQICGKPQMPSESSVVAGTADTSAASSAPPAAGSAAPTSTVTLDMLAGHKLLAVNPRVAPYRVTVPEVCVSDGETYRSMVRICVDESGTVSTATLLQPSAPFIDEQLPDAVRRWRFHPYLLDGRPTPFCYDLRYMVTGGPS
jgi:hypothetical protein